MNNNQYQLSYTAADIDAKLGEIDNLVSSAEQLTTHINNTKNPHGIEDVNNLQLKHVICEATPDTLVDVIANAQSNTTINLAAGDYELLSLIGNTSYPENLTLTGSEGANIAGIIITSGQHNGDLYRNSDISGAIMPRGLTFKGITFTDKFNAYNCALEDLTIDGCTFNENTHLWLNATTMKDEYGHNYGNVITEGATKISTRPSYCLTRFKNVTVKNCTFNNAYSTAIYASSVDGMTVQDNTINGASSNAVQITGPNTCRSIGNIYVVNNESNNTGSRSLRFSYIDKAKVYVGYNKLKEANLAESNSEYAKLNYCTNSTVQWVGNVYYEWREGTGYHGVDISVGKGIVSDVTATEMKAHIADKNNPHDVTAEQIGAATLKDLGSTKESFPIQYDDVVGITGDDPTASFELKYVIDIDTRTGHNCDLLGKTLAVNSYAFGDMAYNVIDGQIEGEDNIVSTEIVNPNADIINNPESGICEFKIKIPEDSTSELITIEIPFYNSKFTFENDIMIKIYEDKGTVWNAIADLNKCNIVASGTGSHVDWYKWSNGRGECVVEFDTQDVIFMYSEDLKDQLQRHSGVEFAIAKVYVNTPIAFPESNDIHFRVMANATAVFQDYETNKPYITPAALLKAERTTPSEVCLYFYCRDVDLSHAMEESKIFGTVYVSGYWA